jgi:hypothetical protein
MLLLSIGFPKHVGWNCYEILTVELATFGYHTLSRTESAPLDAELAEVYLFEPWALVAFREPEK